MIQVPSTTSSSKAIVTSFQTHLPENNLVKRLRPDAIHASYQVNRDDDNIGRFEWQMELGRCYAELCSSNIRGLEHYDRTQ